MAERMDLSQEQVSRIERGRSAPSFDQVERWAEICGVTVGVLDPSTGLASDEAEEIASELEGYTPEQRKAAIKLWKGAIAVLAASISEAKRGG